MSTLFTPYNLSLPITVPAAVFNFNLSRNNFQMRYNQQPPLLVPLLLGTITSDVIITKKSLWIAYTVIPSVVLSGRILMARIGTWSGSDECDDDWGNCASPEWIWTARKLFCAASNSARGWLSFNVAPNPVVSENWVKSSCKKIIFSDNMAFISDNVFS